VDPSVAPHRFMATKTALEALETSERGDPVVGGSQVFSAFVEGELGGPRSMPLGGKTVGRKPPVEQSYLRAAAIALWEKSPAKRTELVKEARVLLNIRSEQALRKLVENHDQRHDPDPTKSRSPMSVHMPLVKSLIEKNGYKSLMDFA
jgi:hypothetical protein